MWPWTKTYALLIMYLHTVLYIHWVTNTEGGIGQLLLHATLINIAHPYFITLHKIYEYYIFLLCTYTHTKCTYIRCYKKHYSISSNASVGKYENTLLI